MASYDFFAPVLGTWAAEADERAFVATAQHMVCDYDIDIHLKKSDLVNVLSNISLAYAEAGDVDFDPNGAAANNPPVSQFVSDGHNFDLNKIENGTAASAWIGTLPTRLVKGYVDDSGADVRYIDDGHNLVGPMANGYAAGGAPANLTAAPGGAAAIYNIAHNADGGFQGLPDIISAGLARALSKQMDLSNGTDENLLRLLTTDDGYENLLAFPYDGAENAAASFTNFQVLMSGKQGVSGDNVAYSTYTNSTVAQPHTKDYGSHLLFNLISDYYSSSDAGTFTIDGDQVTLTDAAGLKSDAGQDVTVAVYLVLALEIDIKDQTTGGTVSSSTVSPTARGPAPAGDGTLTAKQVAIQFKLIFDDQPNPFAYASASGAEGTSLTSNLNQVSRNGYFLESAFTLTYDFTQKVKYDSATGAHTTHGVEKVIEDHYIDIMVYAGFSLASAQGAWAQALVGAGGAGNEAAAFFNSIGTDHVSSLKNSINAVYGFTPADLSSVTLPYNDPANYLLEFVQPAGSRAMFKGVSQTLDSEVAWSLSYCSAAGNAATKYSTIMSGIYSGYNLNISQQANMSGVMQSVEYPVSGNGSSGIREAYFITDISSLLLALSPPAAASGSSYTWLYGTLAGQDGWSPSTFTNNYAQPDSFAAGTVMPGDQDDRGESIVGVGMPEVGASNSGSNAWWFKRGYSTVGSGVPNSPILEPAGPGAAALSTSLGGDGVARDKFSYSFTFKAVQSYDNSQITVVAATHDMTDRAMNYLLIDNVYGGIRVRTYDMASGYVLHAENLDWNTFHTIHSEMTYDATADQDSWVTTIDGVASSSALGYFNEYRKNLGHAVVPAARVRFTSKSGNYNGSFLGFVIDDFTSESWESSDQAGTSSSYSTTFE